MTGLISITSGKLRKVPVSVFGVMRNEMFFLPSFFAHYRKLGIDQFIILDDQSDDGSTEYLARQPDCVLVRSPMRYGERVDGQRAAHLWKNAIPQAYLQDQWAICADADEFLFLPPQFDGFPAFTRTLDANAIPAVAAAMVDFYPSTLREMADANFPADMNDLFRRYPWFDVGPYMRWSRFGNRQVVLHGGVRERLLRKHGISMRAYGKPRFSALIQELKFRFAGDRNIKSIGKVPLVKWYEGRHYLHSHLLDVAPEPGLQLAIAHFKFNGVLYQKIRQALASRSYAGNSRNYMAYGQLLERMQAEDDSFLYEGSRRFISAQSFVDAHLIADAGLVPELSPAHGAARQSAGASA